MYNSFFDEMQKIAFSLADARKATNALKPYLVRRTKKIGVGAYLRDAGPVTTAIRKTKKSNRFAGVPQGTIFAKGDLIKNPEIRGTIPAVKSVKEPKQREMLNRIMLSHEGLERKALSKSKQVAHTPSMRGPEKNWRTHMDPSVILRENNMLATMPKGYTPVKESFKQVRDLDATAPILRKVVPNYTHGQTRFSRHAIKRINQAVAKKGLGPHPSTMEGQAGIRDAFYKSPDARSVAQIRQAATKTPDVGIVRRGLGRVRRIFTGTPKTTKLGLGK